MNNLVHGNVPVGQRLPLHPTPPRLKLCGMSKKYLKGFSLVLLIIISAGSMSAHAEDFVVCEKNHSSGMRSHTISPGTTCRDYTGYVVPNPTGRIYNKDSVDSIIQELSQKISQNDEADQQKAEALNEKLDQTQALVRQSEQDVLSAMENIPKEIIAADVIQQLKEQIKAELREEMSQNNSQE